MPTFKFKAEVERVVLDDIVMEVVASSVREATAIAQRVLEDFPDGHNEDPEAVPYCYIKQRLQEDSQVRSFKRESKFVRN